MRLIDADELLEKVYTIENGGICGDCEVVDRCEIENAPTIEFTEEWAVDKLLRTGWLQRHDRQLTDIYDRLGR